MVRILFALALAATATACTDDAPAAPTQRSATVTTQRSEGERLDGLTITLRLEETVVEQGKGLHGDLLVENRSGERIVDRRCSFSALAVALIPPDDPEADLWQVTVVDCGQELTMPDGFREVFETVDIRATTPTGEALEDGEYLAAVKVLGFSERLSVPVVVRD